MPQATHESESVQVAASEVQSFQFGTDEAGYGPNLGPLVVSGTLWKCSSVEDDLFQQLANICSARKTKGRLHVADSKKVYSGNLQNLEDSVLSMVFAITGSVPESLDDLLAVLNCQIDWCRLNPLGFSSMPLPLVSAAEQIAELGGRLRNELETNAIDVVGLQSSIVMPDAFNRLVDVFGNKASLLSNTSLGIVNDLLSSVGSASAQFRGVCDKHGGRNSYAGLLQELVTGQLIRTVVEGRAESCYRWTEGLREFEIGFQTGGESFFATAVSSMVSKYLRELFMSSWNAFWCAQVIGIRPTKGYPADAKRFKAEILEKQRELGISDYDIWRCR